MSSVLLMVVMFGMMYLFLVRPEQKRKKEAQAMRDSLKAGDEITTICAVKENTVVFETGADRVRLEITKWAIANKGTATDETAK